MPIAELGPIADAIRKLGEERRKAQELQEKQIGIALTIGQLDFILGLLYAEVDDGNDKEQSDFIDTLIDQFERSKDNI